jgi:hypothetical protein
MSTEHKLLLSVSTHHRNFILIHESDEGKARTEHKLLLSVSTHHRNFILIHESDEGKARTEDKLVSYRIYI